MMGAGMVQPCSSAAAKVTRDETDDGYQPSDGPHHLEIVTDQELVLASSNDVYGTSVNSIQTSCSLQYGTNGYQNGQPICTIERGGRLPGANPQGVSPGAVCEGYQKSDDCEMYQSVGYCSGCPAPCRSGCKQCQRIMNGLVKVPFKETCDTHRLPSPSVGSVCDPCQTAEGVNNGPCGTYQVAAMHTSPTRFTASPRHHRLQEQCQCEVCLNESNNLYSKKEPRSPKNLYKKHEGLVVIRPIAYRPAAPSPAQLAHGLTSPSGPIAGVGGRPPQDPRYTSTPALPKANAPHYGSLGDLKTLGCSMERRGFGTPLTHVPPPAPHGIPHVFTNNNNNSDSSGYHVKHSSMTHLNQNDHSNVNFIQQNNSSNNKHHGNNNNNNNNSHVSNANTSSNFSTNGIRNSNNDMSSIYRNTNAALDQSSDSGRHNSATSPRAGDAFLSSSSSSSSSSNNSNNISMESCGTPSSIGRPSSHKSPLEGGGGGCSSSSHDSSISPQPCLPSSVSHPSSNSSHQQHNGSGGGFSNNINNHHHQQQIHQSPQHRGGNTNTFTRNDSLKNLNSASSPSSASDSIDAHHSSATSTSAALHQHHFHHLHHHHHHRMGGSVSNLSRIGNTNGIGSSINGGDLVNSSSSNIDRSASVTGSNFGLSRVGRSMSESMTELDDPHQTPSPSDSGVAELEAILKEKDSEISQLKESMEQNEQIIFKVYEEKEQTWEREVKRIREVYEARLKAAQQRALSMEHSLSTQAYQLQQERRKVSSEAAEARRERDADRGQQQQLQQTVTQLKTQLEETEWGLCQKSGEISLLKSQLKECQGDQTSRGHELLQLRGQLRLQSQELDRRRAEANELHELTSALRRETAELRAQLLQQRINGGGTVVSKTEKGSDAEQLRKALQDVALMREEQSRERCRVLEERGRWKQEKERVLLYQRQLKQQIARLQGSHPPPAMTPPPVVPPLPHGYSHVNSSPPPPPPGVLSEEALC